MRIPRGLHFRVEGREASREDGAAQGHTAPSRRALGVRAQRNRLWAARKGVARRRDGRGISHAIMLAQCEDDRGDASREICVGRLCAVVQI
jgi:hypothetical protein